MDKLKVVLTNKKFVGAVAAIVVVVAGAFGLGVTETMEATLVDVITALAGLLG